MFPLLIDTNPINGSKDIALDQVIVLEFSDLLNADTLANADIRLFNYNNNTPVSVNWFPYFNGSVVDMLDPEGLKACNQIYIDPVEYLNGMTEYRLTVAGLQSLPGEYMNGSLEVRFTTEASSVAPPVQELPSEDLFEVIMAYPKEGTVVTPKIIKIKCSETINQNSDKSKVMIIEGSNIEEALFLGSESLVSTDDITITGEVLEITPPTFKPATEYSIIIDGITNETGTLIDKYEYSFISQPTPMYATLNDVKKISSVSILTSGTSDIDLMNIISDNSKLAMFLAEQAQNTDIDWVNLPLYVVKYVETKTQYDIIFDKIIKLSSGDSTYKQLKDLTIEYGFSLADLLKLADNLKQIYLYWENFIKKQAKKGMATPAVFRKGENADEVPEYKNRGFKDLEGERSW